MSSEGIGKKEQLPSFIHGGSTQGKLRINTREFEAAMTLALGAMHNTFDAGKNSRTSDSSTRRKYRQISRNLNCLCSISSPTTINAASSSASTTTDSANNLTSPEMCESVAPSHINIVEQEFQAMLERGVDEQMGWKDHPETQLQDEWSVVYGAYTCCWVHRNAYDGHDISAKPIPLTMEDELVTPGTATEEIQLLCEHI
ncbi:hypothetical protein EDB19DRAFT_1831814 [Suillus lakei]|nr:hypothetical protein EDB19DRAFT_1831814 [Suillus lakei]